MGGPRGETKVCVLVGDRSVWYTVVGVGLVGDCRKYILVSVWFDCGIGGQEESTWYKYSLCFGFCLVLHPSHKYYCDGHTFC